MRIANGEGSSNPPVLIPEMTETMRQLTLNETTHKAAQKAEIEKMKKKQSEWEEVLEFHKSVRKNILFKWNQTRGSMSENQDFDGYGGVGSLEQLVDKEE